VKLLADTSALLALFIRTDQYHRRTVQYLKGHPTERFVVTDLILNEVVTRLRARAGPDQAALVGRELAKSRRYELLFVDSDLLHGGFDKMLRFADKRLSLTDGVSFETIERLGLDGAFTFDRDFRDCGFAMMPGSDP
jgi:predicted nucleic acid-binding protein